MLTLSCLSVVAMGKKQIDGYIALFCVKEVMPALYIRLANPSYVNM